MSQISSTNVRVLQPEIPSPSIQPEIPPKLASIPPASVQDSVGQEGQTAKGFWFFKKSNQHRRTISAPMMERSYSEPNSPTDATGARPSGPESAESKENYIAIADQLLQESRVRFDGHKKDWLSFHRRFQQCVLN
jgi:hypothetical protein